MPRPEVDWHTAHAETRTIGERIADNVAAFVGSWRFIGLQAAVITFWSIGNVYLVFHFDPFPFILLNLFMSAEAAFSTPIIMMSQNRSADRDRHQADADYQTNIAAKEEIEMLITALNRIEQEKLDIILGHLQHAKTKSAAVPKRSRTIV